MTVKLANMVATFSNSQYSYTAIGMRVNNYASAANSKLMYLEVNNQPRFNVGVDGSVIINVQERPNSNVNILEVKNNNYSVLNLTANLFTINANTRFDRNTQVKSYTEGFLAINTANSNLFLDLSQASVFAVTSSNNYISRINILRPNVAPLSSVDKAHSFSVIFRNIITISPTVWTAASANVRWPSNTAPAQPAGLTAIYTFIGITDANNFFTGGWYGVNSGSNYSL